MGWFEDQIADRLAHDNAQIQDANLRLTSIVMGKKVFENATEAGENAEGEILQYYGVKSLDELASRSVHLTSGWYKDCIGALIAETGTGGQMALIPGKRGYTYYDKTVGKRVKADQKTPITANAICFYRQLPEKQLNLKDLYSYSLQGISKWDVASFFLLLLGAVLLGLFMPYINKLLFATVIPSGNYFMLGALAIMMACVLAATSLIQIGSSLAGSRLTTKINTALSPAVYMRLLSLPVSFYKNYSSGELSARSGAIQNLTSLFFENILTTLVSFIFSTIYLFQIDNLAGEMSSIVVLVLGLILAVSLINTFVSIKVNTKLMSSSAKLSGILYHLISGIQKIKLTGSEKRAYARWAERYGEKAKFSYDPPLMMKIGPALNTAISMLGTILFFAIGAKTHISAAEYMAFTVAYGLICSSILSLGSIVSAIAQLKPNYEMAKPILKTTPENYSEKETLQDGIRTIEFSHLSFRYNIDTPFIFSDLNLKIKNGEYLAIVGKTGCGKSTLLRLLLGFERPIDGSIFINGINMNEIDCKSLRRRMGVVMQTSKLFIGNIFSNISVTNPEMTQEEAWNILQMVGMDEDVKRMPMGLLTLLTDGGGGLSGGQRQRLVIARAIASKPSLLIFDEATSALDNITQKQVSDSLDSLKCTKIVIAHRLSTIKHCDRIIVIDDGQIIEEGTFEGLMERKGYFSELVKRQI